MKGTDTSLHSARRGVCTGLTITSIRGRRARTQPELPIPRWALILVATPNIASARIREGAERRSTPPYAGC